MTEEEFWAALQPVADRPVPIYRLYHDEQGNPLFYSTEDCPGNYIDVDPETYANAPTNVRVVDGKMKIIKTVLASKLKPNREDGTLCHPADIAIVVDGNQPHIKWSLSTNELD